MKGAETGQMVGQHRNDQVQRLMKAFENKGAL